MKRLLVFLLLFSGSMQAQEVMPFVQNGKFSLRKGNVEINPGKIYGAIEKIAFPEYELNGKKYNYIFVLYHGEKVFYNAANIDESNNLMQFAKADGSLITERIFSSYVLLGETVDSQNGLVVHEAEKQVLISPEFEVIETEYINLQPFMKWFIAEDYDKSYILDNKLNVLYIFDDIEFLTETQYVEDNGFYFETVVDITTEPVLIVSKYIDDEPKSAIFQLEEGKNISGWMESGLTPQIEMKWMTDRMLYLYSNLMSEEKGYFIHGMKTGTEIEFERCDVFENDGFQLLMTKRTNDQFYEVHHLRNDSVVKIAQAQYAIPSSELTIYDEPTMTSYTFLEDFMYTQNELEKMGIICLNGKVIDMQYDALIPDRLNGDIVHTVKDQKHGFVNLRTGREIKPFSDSLIVFEKLEKGPEMYTEIGSGKTGYYLSASGNKFYSMRSEPVIFTKKKLFGLQSVSAFTEKTTVVVPAVYVSILKVADNLFLVSNGQQKYGVINGLGDTIIPLKYDQLNNSGIANYWSGRSFYFYKKHNGVTLAGLVSELQGEIIPAAYEEIKPYGNPAKMYNMYLVRNGKYWGLYSGKSMIFDCRFDSFEDQADMYYEDNQYYAAHLGNQLLVRLCYGIPGQYSMQKISRPYDHVIGNYGYVQIGDQFQRYDLMMGEPLELVKDLTSEFSNEYFKIIYKDGKWGAEDVSGTILAYYIYDEAYFKPHDEYIMIARQKDKWYEVDVKNNSKMEVDK